MLKLLTKQNLYLLQKNNNLRKIYNRPMTRLIYTIFCLLLCQTTLASSEIALIPTPSNVEWHNGSHPISKLSTSNSALPHKWLTAHVEKLNAQLPSTKHAISLAFIPVDTFAHEAYRLTINKKGIQIEASGYGGYFNGIQTLRQLVLDGQSDQVPFCVIEDKPAFNVRGVMFDVGRFYLSIPFLKQTLEQLSHYKINLLHLHLTDDPGWRMEVKGHPKLTDSASHWATRLPGKFYTQEELIDLVDFCAKLNMQVLPEIDMPGHSEPFTKAMGFTMQTPEGVEVLKSVIDQASQIFPYPFIHLGSDEVKFTMPNFMPTMIDYVRSKGKEVVAWYPGYVPDNKAIQMCWGENEAGHNLTKKMRYIDCNGFYMDWMDSQSGVYQTFFQQPCEVPKGDSLALGSILAVWADGNVGSESGLLKHYPFYPVALTFAERVWRGAEKKHKEFMAQLPSPETDQGKAFSEFENRLTSHRDLYFKDLPFAYVRQMGQKWRIIGPFDHKGDNFKSFAPETEIRPQYTDRDTILQWKSEPAYGGAVHIRHLFAMFNMHKKRYRPDHWPTLMSKEVGVGDGTCYALTYIDSPKDQEIYLMIGINGMWGHTGGYRTGKAPEQGQWDSQGGDVWLNDVRVEPPVWEFESLPWSGWGKGRIEVPLTSEGYFFRPPVAVKLHKGLNKVLIRSVFKNSNQVDGERKWFFCCMPVQWDGTHFSEVEGLKFVTDLQ